MAKICVYRYEADGEDFPRLCMRCGQSADCYVPQTFAWMPSWVFVFILFGLLPFLLIALLTRKTMRIVAPMCTQHAGHWRVRKLYVWLGLLFWIGYGIVLVALADEIPNDAQTPLILFGIFGGLIWLVSAAIYANGAIKASEIRNKGMDLVNVHKDFAKAWNNADND
jgi:hypothetical protein